MKNFLANILQRRWKLPGTDTLETLAAQFTAPERLLWRVCLVVFIGSAATLLFLLQNTFLVERPVSGGVLREGIVGTARFINPLLALSDADRDLTALVYAGLIKPTPDGTLVPELASSYEISPDGRTYTFRLREGAVFHDGVPVSADDVVFTIERAQNGTLKSPKRANFEGVTVEKLGEREVSFSLKQAYAPFLENTTIGILPAHIWKDVEVEAFPFSSYNVEPIGAGPFRVSKVERSKAGTPIAYTLRPFKAYVLGRPFLKEISVRFFGNEASLIEGYRGGTIESLAAFSPAEARRLEGGGARIEHTPLPRIFGVFFNQNNAPVLANHEVREALRTAVDPEKIVRETIAGYGNIIESPIPAGAISRPATSTTPMTERGDIAEAKKILERSGWKWNTEKNLWEKKTKKESFSLSFTLTTGNIPELRQVSELILSAWKELGANVTVKYFEVGDLNQNVIRPRKYDALLFGEIVGRDLDLFAFWHSSQRNDPGLNIALYTNRRVDRLLEEIRQESDRAKRDEALRSLEQEIIKDIPALFLYSPDFLYLLPAEVRGVRLGHVTIPSDRFQNVERWYRYTEKVWHFFAEDEGEEEKVPVETVPVSSS